MALPTRDSTAQNSSTRNWSDVVADGTNPGEDNTDVGNSLNRDQLNRRSLQD